MWEGGFDDLVCEPGLSAEPAPHVPGPSARDPLLCHSLEEREPEAEHRASLPRSPPWAVLFLFFIKK